MKLENIKNDVNKYLLEKKLKLFDITYNKSESSLCVLLDEKLDLDEIENISNDLSNILDKYEDEFKENYILDVSTVGVERPIRNESELEDAINEYIFVKTKKNEYYGTLKKYSDGILELETKNKTKVVNVTIEYKDVKEVRYAVKF